MFNQSKINTMQNKIENLLKSILPSDTEIIVSENRKYFSDGKELKIAFWPISNPINNVRGQYPQIVSLALDLDDMKLRTQIYGCNGGQCIYRIPEKGSYLAMQRIKIPFRKPKPEEKFVLKAIENFAKRWLQAIKDNKDDLMWQNYVNYDEFLNS